MAFSRLVVAALFLTLWTDDARAEPLAIEHTAYVDLLGKGGLYGLGYELGATDQLGAGLTVSWLGVSGQSALSVSPYVAGYPLGRGRHNWFIHAGPQLVRVATDSPVPEWTGDTSTGIGGQVSSGYEYRRGIVVRTYAMIAAGEGGVVPWLGTSIGWQFR